MIRFVRNVSGALYNIDYTTPHMPIIEGLEQKQGTTQQGTDFLGRPRFVKNEDFYQFSVRLEGATDDDRLMFEIIGNSTAELELTIQNKTSVHRIGENGEEYRLPSALRGSNLRVKPMGNPVIESWTAPYLPPISASVDSRTYIIQAGFILL